jgi:hypothetical protein
MYANYLINWFTFSDLSIKKKLELPMKGGGRKTSFYKNIELNIENATLRNTPDKLSEALYVLLQKLSFEFLKSGIIRDLALLGFVTLQYGKYILTNIAEDTNKETPEISLIKQAYKLPKIKKTTDYLSKHNMSIKAKELLQDIPDLIDYNLKESSKLIYAGYLLNWGKYIIEKATLHNIVYK